MRDSHSSMSGLRRFVLSRIDRDLRDDQSGATVVEYTFVFAIIGAALVATLGPIGEDIRDHFKTISTSIDNARGAGGGGGGDDDGGEGDGDGGDPA